MSLICLKCFEVYDERIKSGLVDWKWFHDKRGFECYQCPKNKCNGGYVVEVDELFLPIIKILNQKNYTTTFCCSGHVYESHPHSYISFIAGTELPTIPDMYKIIESEYESYKSIHIDREFSTNKTEDRLYIDIINNAKNVLKWAKELKIR